MSGASGLTGDSHSPFRSVQGDTEPVAAFHCIAIRIRARPLGWSYHRNSSSGPGSSFRYSASLSAISANASGWRAALSPKMSAAASVFRT